MSQIDVIKESIQNEQLIRENIVSCIRKMQFIFVYSQKNLTFAQQIKENYNNRGGMIYSPP